MKKVLCISECCCDLIFGGLDGLLNLGEERYGTHFSMQAGGGANTAVLLQRCGVPTAYWTLLGDDDAGRIVRNSLERSGLRLVDHEHTPCRTPVSAVLSAQGDRAFASFAQPCTLVEDYDALERAIRDADIVHTYLGYCASYPIAQLCERYGTLLSADTSFCDARTELFDTVLPHCDYWKGNEDEALRLSGKSSVSEALDAIASRVKAAAVITRASSPAWQNASCRAMALIAVASIPIESARTGSISFPCLPRQMFPAPTITPISAPMSRQRRTTSASFARKASS